jgi:hypothetical protein
MQTVLTERANRRTRTVGRPRGLFRKPQGPFSFLVLRPASDLFLWLWRLERRIEFLYRPQFDRWCRAPLFSAAQGLQNVLRKDEHLRLTEERLLPGEE